MKSAKFGKSLFASVATLLLLPAGAGLAQQSHAPGARAASAASDIANAFSQIGDGIYEHCIFELSQEQIEVQQALIGAYVKHTVHPQLPQHPRDVFVCRVGGQRLLKKSAVRTHGLLIS